MNEQRELKQPRPERIELIAGGGVLLREAQAPSLRPLRAEKPRRRRPLLSAGGMLRLPGAPAR